MGTAGQAQNTALVTVGDRHIAGFDGPCACRRAGQDRRRNVAAAGTSHGYPALILKLNGEIDSVVAVQIDDGLITGLYAVRNPDKLSHMQRETTLRR